MQSPACSVSTALFPEPFVPVTTTSEFFQDFTSMRPLPTLRITTTGRPLTVKCFSTRCGGALAAIHGDSSTPAPLTGRIALLLHTVDSFISVQAPPAIHHRGQ